ncbi:hypothetical protein EVAR_29528_1 [Eumeta japonica]|uniref:Uncharacterized protein n=1 Tax=Eumeta variegata TaxID=151549 RepID=A0A4C1WIJ0_EUMVA|nr:hypothetical protein EVAR_29528_1 [Eumeta japonica]
MTLSCRNGNAHSGLRHCRFVVDAACGGRGSRSRHHTPNRNCIDRASILNQGIDLKASRNDGGGGGCVPARRAGRAGRGRRRRMSMARRHRYPISRPPN